MNRLPILTAVGASLWSFYCGEINHAIYFAIAVVILQLDERKA